MGGVFAWTPKISVYWRCCQVRYKEPNALHPGLLSRSSIAGLSCHSVCALMISWSTPLSLILEICGHFELVRLIEYSMIQYGGPMVIARDTPIHRPKRAPAPALSVPPQEARVLCSVDRPSPQQASCRVTFCYWMRLPLATCLLQVHRCL